MYYWWLVTLKAAVNGDEIAQSTIRVENQNREEKGMPTLEEEVLSPMPEVERQKLIAKIRSAYYLPSKCLDI